MTNPSPHPEGVMPLALDRIAAFETPNMRLLRANGPIARRLNEEAARDYLETHNGK